MENHLGHRERLRQRFERAGIEGFAPHEAVELLLTFAIPRKDVKPIAHDLLRRFGSPHALLQAPREELLAVPGIGDSAATLLTLLLPLYRRYQESLLALGEDLSTDAALAARCMALFVGERLEKLYVLSLDPKGRLLHTELISSGDEGETAVYPRLIAAALLRSGAHSAVLCHNHPDGDPQPSRADIQLTAALKQMLAPLSIRLRDHVVVAGERHTSLRAAGLLTD